ncbi:MAG: carboxymuconolactone decarboxylase family protein [Candidatus Omnitrophica bacterium]|nr:carboxymuconolactone decarboxylase family protein [Candidatus Omnitrophota bacterium]
MPTINPVTLVSSNPEQKKLLEGLKAKMGRVPNIYATMAQSPATLEAVLNFNAGLKKGSLSPQEIEAIALAVGEKNSCHYCLAAHTVMGKMAGLSLEEMLDARQGKARDEKLDRLVKLAVEIVSTQGRPQSETIEAFRKAGYSDAALVEVVAWVSFNILTNYINHVADTEVDFPLAPSLGA